jgi:spermidine/putrescine-binding protein
VTRRASFDIAAFLAALRQERGYQWGSNVLMYNTKVFPTPPKSWGVVFIEQKLPDGKSNKGRVEAYDGPIYVADAALPARPAPGT